MFDTCLGRASQTEETRTVRAVKGDLMMERDLIKHMKMVRAQIVNGEILIRSSS